MKSYTNPIIPTGTDGHTADPYVLRYQGFYYHCYMKRDGVYLSVTEQLCDLNSAKEFKVFDAPAKGPGAAWYAPELHYIDGVWYIYGAPQIDEEGTHCMSVLAYEGETPMGKYEYKGMIRGLENTWCIDATVLHHEGEMFFIWTTCAQMYMSRMDTPFSITGDITALTHPEYEFETKQGVVNEGPAILKRGNKIHIVYSANDSKTDDYCLGLLTYSGGNVMDISNWEKSKTAVFEKTEDIYGPGHCSFTTVTEDGGEADYIVYHANLESGSGWHGRSVWIQKFDWDENDMPVFGVPHR